LEVVKKYKNTTIEFPDYRAITLAMWILESGRGQSPLGLEHLNFSGMKYDTIITDLCKRVTYKSSYYCEFENLDNFIKGFWGFLEQEDFKGWRKKETALEFILHIAPVWSTDAKYSSKVIDLLPEAGVLLDQAEVVEGTETDGTTDSEANDEEDNNFLIPGRPSIILSEDSKKAKGQNGMNIRYSAIDNCPYGVTATKNKKSFTAIIIHHTSPKHSTDWYVQYQFDGDSSRGGHFGYHFYISPEGEIVQGAPLTKRTNHISPTASVRRKTEIQNTNTIGISCVGAAGIKPNEGFFPTDEQITAVEDLVFALCDLFDIPFSEIHGHGEIQTNRHIEEGKSIAEKVRSWNEG
jgi:hypothetical protein